MTWLYKRWPMFFTVLLLGGGFLASAKAGESPVISYNSLTEAKMDCLVVARVGNINITAREFLLSYEYGPAFVKRGDNSVRRYLEFMINEKLLALEGYSNRLETSARVRETLAEIEGDLATEELFKDEVMSAVLISRAEIDQAVAREKTHLALKWLFTASSDEAQRLYRQIGSGADFDSLFALQLQDSLPEDERFLEMSRFRLELKNPPLSQIVDTLAFGTVSHPILAPDGWYLVKVVDIWTDAMTTETQENKLRHDVRHALFKRKMDTLSDQYVRAMMAEADPVIVRKTFDLLRAYIGQQILSPEKYAEWDLLKQLMEEYGPMDFKNIEEQGDRTLVRLRQGTIDLRQFLRWYRTRETAIRISTASQEKFFVSLQQLIWRMMRDHLLVQRASQRGLQNRESVMTQKQWWEEKVIQAAVRSDLSQAIEMTDAQLESYYREHLHRYCNRRGEVLPFEKARSDVRRGYYSEVLNKALLHRVVKLKQQYQIEINQDALERLSQRFDLGPDPRAIDTYVAKKGGTFPRPAFPVIDYEWKAWY